MRRVETLTATGRGSWGGDADVVLKTTSVHWSERFGSAVRVERLYDVEVNFSESRVERRSFPSDVARERFLADSFRSLSLTPVSGPETEVHSAYLRERELAGLSLVRDYIQLLFDGSALSFYVWPVVRREENRHHFGDHRYLDHLHGLIGAPVVAFDVWLDVGICLEFPEATLELPPSRVPPDALEIAMLSNDGCCIEWRTGDVPY
jgi:hypothetical protein